MTNDLMILMIWGYGSDNVLLNTIAKPDPLAVEFVGLILIESYSQH